VQGDVAWEIWHIGTVMSRIGCDNRGRLHRGLRPSGSAAPALGAVAAVPTAANVGPARVPRGGVPGLHGTPYLLEQLWRI